MAPRACWGEWKSRVSIERLLEEIGRRHEFRVVGNRLIGPCPVHGGDNRHAFSVHRERNLWFCFTRCQAGGDVIDLAWRLSGRSWARTAQWLERLAVGSIALDESARFHLEQDRRDRLFHPYTRQLTLDPAHPFFHHLAMTEETLRWFEAGAWPGRGFLEGTVAVRLHDLQGNPLGYAGRRLDPAAVQHFGKWKWPSNYPKAQLLWNWHRVEPDGPEGLVVVEGAWSVMKLKQAGFNNVVALCGVHVSAAQKRLLRDARQLILFLDGDEVGNQATARHLADSLHPRLRVVRPPPGKDPADLNEATLVGLLTTL